VLVRYFQIGRDREFCCLRRRCFGLIPAELGSAGQVRAPAPTWTLFGDHPRTRKTRVPGTPGRGRPFPHEFPTLPQRATLQRAAKDGATSMLRWRTGKRIPRCPRNDKLDDPGPAQTRASKSWSRLGGLPFWGASVLLRSAFPLLRRSSRPDQERWRPVLGGSDRPTQ
jgi:hypothetical protein